MPNEKRRGEKSFSSNLLHSVIFDGAGISPVPSIRQRCREILGDLSNHPDFLVLAPPKEGGTIGVAEVRELLNRMSTYPAVAPKYVVAIYEVGAMTPEAQNAVLKEIEEGAVSVFIMGCKDISRVLPTIVSRVWVEKAEKISFAAYKEELRGLSDSDASLLYFITGGEMPDDEARSLVTVFDKAAELLASKNFPGLLSLLGLEKEKDRNCFADAHPAYVGTLLRFLLQNTWDMATGCGFEYKSYPFIKDILGAIESTYSAKMKTTDFFRTVATIIEWRSEMEENFERGKEN